MDKETKYELAKAARENAEMHLMIAEDMQKMARSSDNLRIYALSLGKTVEAGHAQLAFYLNSLLGRVEALEEARGIFHAKLPRLQESAPVDE